MAVIKCKMCGGDLDISEGLSVCECEYCGTKQTVPSADNEKKLTLFARAGRLRAANEFDKAAGVYESIVADFPEEAEAYWGLVLCRYGIEYVDDPATGKKVPTYHRVSFDSVLEDTDFDQACENADAIARRQYREEAKQIEDIRRGIIEVSGKEEPYDIFICYKETGENGDRTVDSVIAQDVYDALTEKGYRVFFSRISLEDKLGTEYEPYIFAALNSAKVMLAFGTDFEYYHAVWVKNEWSRFLKLMENDKSKHLIPCYKNLDPYDMPKEFHRLQGQDMSKVGAVQDLLRGIEKVLPRKEAAPQPIVQQIIQSGGPNTAAMLQRGNMALEDGEWEKAIGFFDQVLNMDAQNARAYLGMAMAEARFAGISEIAELADINRCNDLQANPNLKKSLRFSAEPQKQELMQLLEQTNRNCRDAQKRARQAAERAERERREAAERAELERREAAERAELAEKKRRAEAIERIKPSREHIAPAQFQIAAGWGYTVGLRMDGSVLAVGDNENGQCSVSGWTDVIAVAAGGYHTVGLRADGSVLASGGNNNGQCSVSDWTDVVAVTAGGYHTVGLRANGSVLAVGNNKYGQCSVSNWSNVVAIAAGSFHTVGLRADGSVLTAGSNDYGRCDVSGWSDVVAIAAGSSQTVGLRADGSVLATGNNKYGQRNVSGWTDVVAVAAGSFHTVGLRADGSVLATGSNDYGRCDIFDWKLFNSMDTLERERREATERAERERREAVERAELERKEATEWAERKRLEAAAKLEAERQARLAALNKEKTALSAELSGLKGIFSGKRRKEIEARLAEIDAELKKLQ